MPVPRQWGELSGSRSHEAGLRAGAIHLYWVTASPSALGVFGVLRNMSNKPQVTGVTVSENTSGYLVYEIRNRLNERKSGLAARNRSVEHRRKLSLAGRTSIQKRKRGTNGRLI